LLNIDRSSLYNKLKKYNIKIWFYRYNLILLFI
jgi:hypothetical protein